MKIAICISGQARTWKVAKDNILKYFDLTDHVDYFIHTWDTNTYRLSNQQIMEKQDSKVPENEFEEIKNFFNPKKMVVDKYDDTIYGKNWNALFYSFMKSVWLKRKYELENDFRYDIVVKIRFDINYNQEGFNKYGANLSKFYVHKVKPLTAYCSNDNFDRFPFEFNRPVFDDVIFYSDSGTMDIISKVYGWNRDIVNRGSSKKEKNEFIEDPEFYMGPGSILYKHITNWNIHPTCEVVIPYYVVRKEVLDLNLHSIFNWNEIRNISKNWYDSVKVVDKKNII